MKKFLKTGQKTKSKYYLDLMLSIPITLLIEICVMLSVSNKMTLIGITEDRLKKHTYLYKKSPHEFRIPLIRLSKFSYSFSVCIFIN